MTDYDFGAGYGYAPGTGTAQDSGGGTSHTSFVIWLLVFTLGSLLILHGLKVGGFTFVFRR
jgi:hypothetical protein